jgi:hypothetical protein
MIESIYVVYNQAIEMFRLMVFIAVTIPLFYYMFKLYIKVLKSIFHRD